MSDAGLMGEADARSETVTIVRTPSLWLAKRIWPDRIEQYSQARHFDFSTEPLTDLDDVGRLLARLIDDPHAAVMRGVLIDPNKTRRVRRLLFTDRKTGAQPTVRDQPRRWVALDIEGIQRPETLPATDLLGCASLAIDALPAAFRDARCIVQASSSHGIKPDIRLRLWFWLSRPTAGDELKRWLAGTPADPAVFSAVAPLYTARPIFQDGMVDPVPLRLAERPGSECVTVPSVAALAPPPEPVRTGDTRAPLPDAMVETFIARVLERVRGAGDGSKHAALRGAAVSLGGIQDRAGFTDREATQWLLQAIATPTSRRKDEDTIAWGLANGRSRPIEFELSRQHSSGRQRQPAERVGKPNGTAHTDLKAAPYLAAAVDAIGRLNLFGDKEIDTSIDVPRTTLPEVPWVPEPMRTVPLAEVKAAVTGITSSFFADAHACAEAFRARLYQEACTRAELQARTRAAKAEQIAEARVAFCDTIVKSRPPEWKAPPGTKQPKAERQAKEKALRAVVTSQRLREVWIAAASRLTAPFPEIPPPVVINAAETGAAKTGITLKMAAAWIETRKAAGLPHRLIWLVPALRPDTVIEPGEAAFEAWRKGEGTPRQRAQVAKFLAAQAAAEAGDADAPKIAKRLGQQTLERAQDIGIDAAIYLGIGEGNCKNLEEVDLTRIAGADPYIATCGTLEGDHCPFLEWCQEDGYKAGVERAATADMVIAASNFVVEDLPLKIRDGAWAVVIDENFSSLTDFETELTVETCSALSLKLAPPVLRNGAIDAVALAILEDHQPRIIEAANACAGGYLTAKALRAACFTPASAVEVRKASWARKREPAMKPGMSLEERQEEAKRCEINAQLGRIASLTYALEYVLTCGEAGAGLISVKHEMRRSGSQTTLIVRGQKKPAAWIADLPVLNLNATANLKDVRLVFPTAVMPPVPRAERPFAVTHQVLGRWGRRNLERNPERVAELRDFIRMQMIGRRTGLVIAYKDIEHLFQGIPGVETEHHGDIAGDDRYRHYDFLMVIGGGFASPEAIAAIAAARGAGAVSVRPPVPMTHVAMLTSGAAVQIPDVMTYENAAVDETHRSIFLPSIAQAAGRQSQIDRTASTPAVTFILANVVMDRPVDSIRLWRGVRLDRLGKMILRGRVVTNANHMTMLHADLFQSPKAASNARQRFAGTVADVIEATREVVQHDPRPWVRIEYQPAGQGQRPSVALIPAAEADDLRAELEAELGGLDWTVHPFTDGEKVVPTRPIQYFERAAGTTSPSSDPIPPAWVIAGAITASETVRAPPDG